MTQVPKASETSIEQQLLRLGIGVGYNTMQESPVNFETFCGMKYEEVKARTRKQ